MRMSEHPSETSPSLNTFEMNEIKTPNPDSELNLKQESSEIIEDVNTKSIVNEVHTEEESLKGCHNEFMDDTCTESIGEINFNQVPLQVTGAWKDFEDMADNYTRGCKWSPDGSCILTNSNDNILRIFNFPQELWNPEFNWDDVKEMLSVLQVKVGVTVNDFSWYPKMTSSDPVTCCFLSCSSGNPVHLWDAFNGELRCTYRPYDQFDEITTPHSVAFNHSGEQIYCGFNKMIRIFDIASPGRSCIERPTYVDKSGQSGIISCFAFSPTSNDISAAGSYNKIVGIYSEPDGTLQHVLSGNGGGVTHVCFSHDGMKLYSGGRNDAEIICWDLRNLGKVLFSMRRVCVTGQRMYFDISKCGRFIISGNNNGIVSIWDTTNEPKEVCHFQNAVLEPVQYFQAHNDCVNGISFHPNFPVIATSSGQRKFPDCADSDDESGKMFSQKSIQRDNCLRLWWFNND